MRTALRAAPPRRLLAVRPLDKLLIVMSEFGENLPASVVIYAVAAIVAITYAVWSGGGSTPTF